MLPKRKFYFFFFNDTATTEIYTLSLHDALPICHEHELRHAQSLPGWFERLYQQDRKSTRLNSSHLGISYAVFCLQKKNVNREVDGHTFQVRRGVLGGEDAVND